MKPKKALKAFISGMAFPAFALPIAYSLLYIFNKNVQVHDIQFVSMYLPLVWGIANALFISMSSGISGKKINTGLWVTGISLGLIVSVFGVFVLKLPTEVFGNVADYQYAPIVFLPILYGIFFRYIVKWLNKTLSV